MQIDWPGIRANAVTLGIRGSARAAAANLPDNERDRFIERVMKRASREGWEVSRQKAMVSAGMSADVSDGNSAMAGTVATFRRTSATRAMAGMLETCDDSRRDSDGRDGSTACTAAVAGSDPRG